MVLKIASLQIFVLCVFIKIKKNTDFLPVFYHQLIIIITLVKLSFFLPYLSSFLRLLDISLYIPPFFVT